MYILQTYDDRLYSLLKAMDAISTLINIYDDDESSAKLQEAYDQLSKKFTEETKNIPDKNGIKQINKDITYYANGLIECNSYCNSFGIKIIGEPFEYENNSKIPEPKYNIFKKPKYAYCYRNNSYVTTSGLISNYLRSKLKNKPAPKMPKISELLEDIKAFAKTIKIPNYENAGQNYTFARQYVTIYEQLCDKYIDALSFVTNVGYEKLDPNTYQIGRVNHCNNPFVPMMMREGRSEYINNLTNEKYGYTRINTIEAYNDQLKKNNINDYKTAEIKMPILSQTDVENIVKLYNDLYAEKIKAYIEKESDHNTPISIICENAEESVQKDIEKYYQSKVKYLDSELLTNDPTFKDWGYAAMLVEREYDPNSKIFGYERIMRHDDNNAILQSEMIEEHKTQEAYLNNQRMTRLFVHSYNGNPNDVVIKTDIDPELYDYYKSLYNKYIENIKKSIDFMILCLDDIIKSLSNIKNNPDFVTWMAKRKIIYPDTKPIISEECEKEISEDTEPVIEIITETD